MKNNPLSRAPKPVLALHYHGPPNVLGRRLERDRWPRGEPGLVLNPSKECHVT